MKIDKLFDNNIKKVKIIDIDNQEFVGDIDNVTDKLNDPEGKDNITIRVGNDLINIYDDEIKSFEVLE